jgi:hypothetical protein
MKNKNIIDIIKTITIRLMNLSIPDSLSIISTTLGLLYDDYFCIRTTFERGIQKNSRALYLFPIYDNTGNRRSIGLVLYQLA